MAFSISGCAKTGAVVSDFFRILKAFSHSGDQMNLVWFFNNSVIGLATFEKSGINQR
jgi:hypothetical protein